MTRTAHGLEDPLAADVHDALDAVYRAGSGSAAVPGWDVVRSGMVRVRRRRRVRRLAATAGGAATALAIVGSLQVNLVPYPGWAPALPAAPSTATFGDRPTRGSLASDSGWLGALREIQGRPREEDGGERWEVVGDGVHVVYAGDVGGFRLALVEVTRRWGALQDTQSRWLVGPRGAAPADLVENGGGALAAGPGGEPVSVGQVGVGTLPSAARATSSGAAVVVLGLPEVTVRSAPTFAPDGSVHWTTRVVGADPDGVITVLAPAGEGAVRVEARELAAAGAVVGPSGDVELMPDPEYGPADLPAGLLASPVHGTTVPTGGARRQHLAWAATALAQDSGSPVAGRSWRTLWTAPGGGPSTGPESILALTLPGGSHRISIDRSDDFAGPIRTLPAGPLEKVALAQRWPTEKDLDDRTPERATEVALLGPTGAVRARISRSGSTPVTVDLRDGYALADAPSAESVEFLDARDDVLARTAVAAWPR